jgi:hypothetical protein
MGKLRMKTVSKKRIEAFEAELDALCAKHMLHFTHEDGHGVGLLYDAEEYELDPVCDISLPAEY